MNTKIITHVSVFPFGLNVEKNNQYEFRMRCRELITALGLGLAWDNSHFIPDKGGFWFHIGHLDSVIVRNLDGNTQDIIWIQEDGTRKVLDTPVLKQGVGNRFSLLMPDSTRVEFEARNLNHLERFGESVMLRGLIS